MSVKEFAEKFIKASNEAYLKGNYDGLGKLEDPNVVYHDMRSGQNRTREAQKQVLIGLQQRMSDRWQEWQYLTGGGNYVAFSLKRRHKLTDRAREPQRAGEEVKVDLLYLFRLKGGKIAEVWSHGTITGLT